MNVLIIDHHFGQDIDALVRASANDDVTRIVPAELFAARARLVFPADVFSDLSRYYASELAPQREAYRKVARSVMLGLYLTFPFDALVLPSDTFFYLRDVIELVREWGIPTVVVQKESGVSAKSLAHHASDLRRWFPFSGDLMTVCSQKSKDFWVAAGTRPDQVQIPGQPRFDVYHTGGESADLAALGVGIRPGRPVLLFLSYDLDAYAEERARGESHRPWQQLHDETEQVLLSLAAAGTYSVVIKPHPQQDAVQLDALADRLASALNTFVVPPRIDTRSLILAADVIVGFQTTAIAEAMIAGKRVVYTSWTDHVDKVRALLLPFHDMADAIDVATSPDDLRARLTMRDFTLSPAISAKRQQYCEPYLGVVDGGAARRVWNLIGAEVDRFSRIDDGARGHLDPAAPAYCRKEVFRAMRRSAAWTILAFIAAMMPGFDNIAKRAIKRRDDERARAEECRERLSGRYRHTAVLRGPRRDGVFAAGRRGVLGHGRKRVLST